MNLFYCMFLYWDFFFQQQIFKKYDYPSSLGNNWVMRYLVKIFCGNIISNSYFQANLWEIYFCELFASKKAPRRNTWYNVGFLRFPWE
jgi:hypothetical protein